MNAHRKSDGDNTSPEKTVEELMRASAKAMEMAMKGEWTKEVDPPTVPLNPLMSHPTAMMAAATVVGMGVSSQIAGMWLGFMKGFSEKQAQGSEDVPAAKAEAEQELVKPVKPMPTKKPAKKIRVVVDNATVAAAAEKDLSGTRDDLKRISGIGPKLASVLEEKGFKDFASIAALDEDAVRALDDELGLGGRIERDDWVGQARALIGDAS